MDKNTLILQPDIIGKLLPSIGKRQWQTLYVTDDIPGRQRFAIWCALLNDDAAAKAMNRDHWDLMMGNGRPGFSQTGGGFGGVTTTYERFGMSPGIRPLVLYRSFDGTFPNYVELDEEFRLYHDLAEDKKRGLLLSFDSSGREIEVVRITENKVQARLKYLRQFQAGLRFHLAIYIESTRFTQIPLADIPKDEHRLSEVGTSYRWCRYISSGPGGGSYETFSRFIGKIILPPPAQKHAGVWPFDEDDREPDIEFIIGIDENGSDVSYTSNPDELSSYFDANSDAPSYLTPIYFRREVLEKYYAEPDRYNVSSGYLSCLGLWGCWIDNDLDTHVVAYLGDLGQYLPYEERLHWKQFNVPPEGVGSETNYRRSILAEFADAKSADSVFCRIYLKLADEWKRTQGWPLFLDPSPDDAHLLSTIRVPATNSQGTFDEQILNLARLLIDSLNEKGLKKGATTLKKGAKGISKLQGFLESTRFPQSKAIVTFLRDLQAIRSAGSAHRKGSQYTKIVKRLGIQTSNKPDSMRCLLVRASELLQSLRLHYCERKEDTD